MNPCEMNPWWCPPGILNCSSWLIMVAAVVVFVVLLVWAVNRFHYQPWRRRMDKRWADLERRRQKLKRRISERQQMRRRT